MRIALLCCVLVVSCASPLQRLSDAIEAQPVHWWGYAPPNTATLEDLQQRLKTAAWYLQVRITYGVPPDNAFGSFSPATRQVIIDGTLPFDAQVQVVAHELCHALQPWGLEDKAEREVFADACAYLVVLPDRDDLPVFARYLGRYRTRAADIIRQFDREIRWAAMVLRLDVPRRPAA